MLYFADFTLWAGAGASLGLWRLARSVPVRQGSARVNEGLFVLIMILAGARLSYIFTNLSYFSLNFIEMPMVWLGGLTWPGAVVGTWLAVISLAVLQRSRTTGKIALGLVGDRLYPLLPPLAITAWLGCWQAGAAYGPPAQAWWAVPSLDESGALLMRWPVQLAAAASLLIFFALLETFARLLNSPGWLSGLASLGMLVHFLIFSILCIDPAPYWKGLRVDTWAACVFLLFFCVYWLFNGLVISVRRFL